MNTEQKIDSIFIKNGETLKEVLQDLQKQLYAIEERLERLEDGK